MIDISPGACRILPSGGDPGAFGTLGCVLRMTGQDTGREERLFLLTCAHVLAGQGGAAEVVTTDGVSIATAIRTTDPATDGVDAAIAELLPPVASHAFTNYAIPGIGRPRGWRVAFAATVGTQLLAYGARSTRLCDVTVRARSQAIEVAAGVTLQGQLLCDGAQLDRGDSGAILVDHANLIVGMLVAIINRAPEHPADWPARLAVVTPINIVLGLINQRFGLGLEPLVDISEPPEGSDTPDAPRPGSTLDGAVPTPRSEGPRAWRNCNPGNMRPLANDRWLGQVAIAENFVVFEAEAYGWRALAINLRTYRNKHGIRSLLGITNRWAPSADGNRPVAYAEHLLATLRKGSGTAPAGIQDDFDFLEPGSMRALAKAIALQEDSRVKWDQPDAPSWHEAEFVRGMAAAGF